MEKSKIADYFGTAIIIAAIVLILLKIIIRSPGYSEDLLILVIGLLIRMESRLENRLAGIERILSRMAKKTKRLTSKLFSKSYTSDPKFTG